MGIAAVWLAGRFARETLSQLGDTIEQVATATATATANAIGQGVQTAYTPPPEPPRDYPLLDNEGEALPAWDPTYDFIPDPEPDRIALIRPGESLLPPGANP